MFDPMFTIDWDYLTAWSLISLLGIIGVVTIRALVLRAVVSVSKRIRGEKN
jgi:hypothetical protein